MPVFPSSEWIAAFCDELAAHERAGDLARSLEGSYHFVVTPAGTLASEHAYDLRIGPDGDGGATVTPLSEPAAAPTLEVAANYDRWQQLIRGDLDLGLAVMLRRVRLSGDVSGLLSRIGDAAPLVDALHRVDTTFL